jgi:restriction endonuclease
MNASETSVCGAYYLRECLKSLYKLDLKEVRNLFSLLDERYLELMSKEAATGLLAPLPTEEAPAKSMKKSSPVKEEDKAMYNTVAMATQVAAPTMESQQKQHFLERISTTFYLLLENLAPVYGLRENTPKTPDEVIERIKNGEYVIKGRYCKNAEEYDEDEDRYYTNPFTCFRWRKPELKRDQAGYEAASERLSEARSKALDAVWAATDAKEYLKIVEKFEKFDARSVN